MLLVTIAAKAQKKNNAIQYVLPDRVELLLDSCIKKSEGQTKFFFIIRKDSLYNISIVRYKKNEERNLIKWVEQTNRYLRIADKIYPLLFDYDFALGAIDNNNIGEFKNRDDNVKRISLINHGLIICFNLEGSILKVLN